MHRCFVASFSQHQGIVAICCTYYHDCTICRNMLQLLQHNEGKAKRRHITTNTCFVAIRNHFFATIYMVSATCQNCCNICQNITTKIYFVAIPGLYCNKMTSSRNVTQLSQYHYHITTLIRLVAIHDFYCNKRRTYRDERKLW